MNKKKLIGKAALLLSLPMLISSVKGLEASFASDEQVNVKQAEKDSTNAETSTKDEKKKENKAKYKVITRLESLKGGKEYDFAKFEEKYGNIGEIALNEDPETQQGFQVVKADKEKTISQDGSTIVNIYYDRLKNNLTIMKQKENGERSVALKTPLKYGESTEAAISSLTKDVNGLSKDGWVITSAINNRDNIHTGYPTMKDQNIILFLKNGGNVKYTTSYVDEENLPLREDTYFYNGGGTITYSDDDAIDIPGYMPLDKDKWENLKKPDYRGKIKYTKKTYNVTFIDKYGEDKTIQVGYNEKIDDTGSETDLEKGQTKEINGKEYKFEGWYDNPEFKDKVEFGGDVDLTRQKMPAHDMAFFAKWTPINGDTEEEPELQDDPNVNIIEGEEKGPEIPNTPPEEPKTPEENPKEDESPKVPKDEEKEPNVDTDTEEGKEGSEEDKDTETNPSPMPTPDDKEGEDKPETTPKDPDEDKKPEEGKDDSNDEKIEEIPEKDDSKEEPEANSEGDKEEPQEDQEEDSDDEMDDSEDGEEESEELEEDEESEDPDEEDDTEEDDTEEELEEDEDLEEDESDDEEDSEEMEEEDIDSEDEGLPEDAEVEYSSLDKVESIEIDNPTIKIKAGLQKTLKLIFKDKDGKIINVKTSSLTVTDVKGEDNTTVDKELLDAGNHSLDAKLVELAILKEGLKSGEYTISIKIKDDNGVEKPFDLKIRLYNESQPWEDIKPIEPKEEDSKEDNSSEDKEQSPEKDKDSDSQSDDPNNTPDGSEKDDSHKDQSPKDDSKKDDKPKDDSSKKREKNRRLYERLKMALERYKKAIENLKKYRQRYITKTNKDKEFIEKMDTLLEQSDSLIKRAERLLEILKRS